MLSLREASRKLAWIQRVPKLIMTVITKTTRKSNRDNYNGEALTPTLWALDMVE